MSETERGLQSANEIWQVEVNGIIYEAPFFELGDWIDGGSLLPDDKVRRGNLRWIEAKKVPSLVPFFNAKAQGLPMPVVISTTNASLAETTAAQPEPGKANNVSAPVSEPTAATIGNTATHSVSAPAHPAAINPDICAIHADLASFYICDGCGNGFCKACPRSYGGSVKICPMCGSMCRAGVEVHAARHETTRRTVAINQGFGAGDFFNALSHPFKFKVSLFFGALMFALFSIGQSASAIGGIILVASALICAMLANMLSFGVLANTIDNFTQGKLDENFMPEFESFSIWDDVVHPFFLSIGAYLSSFGPLLVVVAIGYYLVISAVTSQMNEFQSEVERIPGTNVYAGRQPVEQSKEVREVLDKLKQEQAERVATITQAETEAAEGLTEPTQTAPVIDQESKDQEELWAQIQEMRGAQLESTIGKSPETEARETQEMLKSFLGLAAPLIVIGFIALLWGLLYFPAACAVAGYTKSFVAAINPIVGLDTIRRLGLTYVKILFMGLVLLIFSGIVSMILHLVFSPFDLPRMGNLPAIGLGSMFTFYLAVVFSCILGYALFKSADKLDLNK